MKLVALLGGCKSIPSFAPCSAPLVGSVVVVVVDFEIFVAVAAGPVVVG